MKNLFDAATAADVKARLSRLGPSAERLWGTMTAPQALAHCSAGFEMALGKLRPPRKFIGRLIGGIIKPMALRDDAPMRRNSPTVDGMVVKDDRDLAKERDRLSALIDKFSKDGPTSCTTHPHPFFGSLTPPEWAILMYKHVDHHLRQFGA